MHENFFPRKSKLMIENSTKSFTLLELLIVIGILAILATTVALVLNPAELLRQARDSQRLSDINILNKAISLYQTDGNSSFGYSTIVYVSIPDSSSICANLGLPSLSASWSYSCSNSDNYKKVDGTDWIPVPFTSISYGSPLAILPIDPINATSTDNYYTYVPGGSWKLTAILESNKYSQAMVDDKGPNNGVYEIGTDINLSSGGMFYQRAISATNGLISYWKMDNDWIDSKGLNNGTANNGATFGTKKYGSAAGSFDGINDYVNIGNAASLNITGDITLEGWIKLNSFDPVNGDVIISKWANPYQYLLMSSATKKALISIWTGANFPSGTQYTLEGTTVMSAGTWYYIVGVKSGSNMYIYMNGILEGTLSGVANILSTNSVVEIDRAASAGVLVPDGSLDEVVIYNRALTSTEILNHYNSGN